MNLMLKQEKYTWNQSQNLIAIKLKTKLKNWKNWIVNS